jgi:hypothetical protein
MHKRVVNAVPVPVMGPEEWLEYIEELQRNRETGLVRRALQSFRRFYPHFPVRGVTRPHVDSRQPPLHAPSHGYDTGPQ